VTWKPPKIEPPKWQVHEVVDYDRDMGARCASLLNEIQTDPGRRQAILNDPCGLHRELFHAFAPVDYPEYAGTYRGVSGTTLEGRRSASVSQLDPTSEYEFVPPNEVVSRMEALLADIRRFIREQSGNQYNDLIALAYGFAWFGKIHPFLDGNGHVQRAIFAVMAAEFGYSLSPRFAIHPRPYDRLLAAALEIFSNAPKESENEELGLVAEYLAFFLEEPFNRVRAHLPTASLYP
jgi:fido (protein-threonine AMPylation protein)